MAALSRDSRRDQRDSAVSLRVRPAVDDDDDAGRRDDDDDLPSYPLSDAPLLTHSHTRRANQEEEDDAAAAGVRLEPIQGAISCARIAGEKQMRVTNENLAKTVRAAPQWTLIASRLTRMAIPPTTSYNRQPKGQVIRDSEARLFNFGFLFLLRGTVLQSWFYWTQLASLIGISVVALIISYFYSSPFHCHSKHCAEFHEYRWNQRDFVQVYEDLDLLEIIVSVMTIMLVPEYVASLYLRFTVNIWWTLRFKTLQELMNVASSMAQRAAIYFPGQDSDSLVAKETIMRYGVLSVALFWKDAREIDAWTMDFREKKCVDDLSDLVQGGLLSEAEAHLLQTEYPTVKSQVVWVWLASFWTKLCLDGKLPAPNAKIQGEMLKKCTHASDQIRTMLARLNTQYPSQYGHIVAAWIKVGFFVSACITGYVSAIAIITRYYWYVAVCFAQLIITILFYQGILQVKEHINNPFLDQKCDFPWQLFHARLVRQCVALYEAGSQPPYVVPPGSDGDVPKDMRRKPAQMPPQLPTVQISSTRMK